MRKIAIPLLALAVVATVPTISRPAEADVPPRDPIIGTGPTLAGLYPTVSDLYSGEYAAMAAAVGKSPTFTGMFHTIYESDGWAATDAKLEKAWSAGTTPFSNLEFSVTAAVVAGTSLNAQIDSWATALKVWLDRGEGRSLIIAPMQEMNGDWIPYGMDPANFIAGYRKIRSRVESVVGPSNRDRVRWAFAPNGWSEPPYGIADYYPGDAYVDVISFSTYNFGDYDVYNGWLEPSAAILPYVNEARDTIPGAVDKPFLLSQTGSVSATGNKNAWIEGMFDVVEDDPNLVGFIYFNLGHSPHDWTIWETGTTYSGYTGYRNAMLRPATTYQFPLTNWFQPGPLPFTQSFEDPCTGPEACDSLAFVDAGSEINILDDLVVGAGVNEFYYGMSGDTPLMGDWNGDGTATPGMYRPSSGFVYLRNSNDLGVADLQFFFGIPGDIPLVGDWDGDGTDTLGIYRNGQVFITNTSGTGNAEHSFWYGVPGDRPFTGDFDGDGKDTVGLYRESSGFVYFRNSLTSGFAESEFFYGAPSDKILAGDWNGDGTDTVAVYRPSANKVYFRMSNTFGVADYTLPVAPGFVAAMTAR
ncbi:MAG: glycosyl hydrolase [Acidimicrobiia bacterium]|nr:glycosyl hydrolase [Acidimicrobiia bacterium]